MKKQILKYALVIGLFVLIATNADAQCAMCKMSAENAAEENQGFAEGLNTGILYLMGIPYALMLIGGLVFFRKLLKRDEEQQS